MVKVCGVSHHYGIRPVLRGIDLEVGSSELLALMGPNGMGKSTLMAIIAGVLAPLKGHVEIDGQRRRSSPEVELAIRRKVAYLSAEPWLPLMISGREWVLAVGRLYGVEDDRLMEHTQRLLTAFDLADKADSSLYSYSTGQRKKAALCCALVSDAPILLLDEPFAGGLDPSAILALKRILQHLVGEAKATIIMSTPVPELVEELASRIAMLRDGQIVACDTIAGLRAHAGDGQSLHEIYQRLVSPHSARNIDQYFGKAPQ
jgi:ABC-type multidrug transport system ATPase subunit